MVCSAYHNGIGQCYTFVLLIAMNLNLRQLNIQRGITFETFDGVTLS